MALQLRGILRCREPLLLGRLGGQRFAPNEESRSHLCHESMSLQMRRYMSLAFPALGSQCVKRVGSIGPESCAFGDSISILYSEPANERAFVTFIDVVRGCTLLENTKSICYQNYTL